MSAAINTYWTAINEHATHLLTKYALTHTVLIKAVCDNEVLLKIGCVKCWKGVAQNVIIKTFKGDVLSVNNVWFKTL